MVGSSTCELEGWRPEEAAKAHFSLAEMLQPFHAAADLRSGACITISVDATSATMSSADMAARHGLRSLPRRENTTARAVVPNAWHAWDQL